MRWLQCVLLVCFLVCVSFVDGRGQGGCSQIPRRGNCTNKNRTWYFDKSTGTCKLIWLGACPKKWNNYNSCQECLNRCHLNKMKKKTKNDKNALKPNMMKNRCIIKA
uniref:Pancreatic trypsin inhibitor n=1 Tax=Rhipicephalus appendiculatus TaxID=34631 RepID=A0A131YHR3_RHIAP